MADSESTLLSGRQVKLSTGESVRLSQWSVRRGQLVLDPINSLLVKSNDEPDLRIAGLINFAFDEIFQIVLVTLQGSNPDGEEWTRERLGDLPMEDMIELATQVFEECLVREDGGGLMGKMQRFGDVGGNLLLTAALGPEKMAEILAEQKRQVAAALPVPKKSGKGSSPARAKKARGRKKTKRSR